MSTPDDKRPVTWKTLARVADDANAADAAEVSALSSMSDAEIDAQLAAAGFAPGDAARLVDDALATPAKPTGLGVVAGRIDGSRRAPRTSPWPLIAFAAAAVVLGLLFWKRAEVVALFSPHAEEPIGPDREGPVQGPTPGQLEQARVLRNHAAGACADQFWPDCQDALDRAAKLDPAGDTAPEVQAFRKNIDDAKRAPPMPSGGHLKP